MQYQHDNPIVLQVQTAVDKDIELNRTGRVTGILGLAHSEIENASGRLKELHELGTLPDEVLNTLNALVQQVGICRGIYLSRLNERRDETDAREQEQVKATEQSGAQPRRSRIEIDAPPPVEEASPLDASTYRRLRHLEID
tara:strand:- start:824 stop:1246 length:423 start_codon:yes stop_codon:yes gene_type:complete